MPRPNQGRAILSEDGLAQRIAHERARCSPPMTYESLAKRMTDHGCPIQPSAIYKIEKGTPRRRITVDELVALSRVFDIPVEELLLPPDLVNGEELRRLHAELEAAERQVREAMVTAAGLRRRIEDLTPRRGVRGKR